MRPGGGFHGKEALTRRELLHRGAYTGAALALLPAGRFIPPRNEDRRLAPDILRRRAWGADESRRGAAAYDAVVEKIVLHHTGTRNDATDWADEVRRIYENEIRTNYRDIAYHYLVDPRGRIYEGRWARDYPRGDAPNMEDDRGWNVRGGHALHHNPRTLGISLLGDYTQVRPTEAALASIVELFVWKCSRWNLDPVGSSRYCDTEGAVVELPNIVPHGAIRVTECPGTHLNGILPQLRDRTVARVGHRDVAGGYWVVGDAGQELVFGSAPALDHEPARALAGVVAHPQHAGYWAFASDGGVFAFGDAAFHGSLGGHALNAPAVGMAVTPAGDGYWIAAADGGVFAFGNATFAGSVSAAPLLAPMAGIAATTSGSGYWCAAADGGVFAFGDAPYLGSLSGTALTAPVVAIATHQRGYWLVARDGGVFAFGDAPYFGSGTTGAPISAFAPTASGQGYYLVTEPGEVLPFGDATYHGSALGRVARAVGLAPA